MITIFYKDDKQILRSNDMAMLEELGHNDILWIDLNEPNGNEKRYVEEFLQFPLQSRAQAEEIESSSRYSETEEAIFANSNFLIAAPNTYNEEPVSFILAEEILITLRHSPLRSFADIERRLLASHRIYPTGYHLLIAILENRIDMDADMIEVLAKEVAHLSKRIGLGEKVDEEILLDINQLQENTMLIRENIIDKQRVISGILKSDKFPGDIYSKLNVLMRDISSLINHTDFSFERLEYMQNTVLGLINIEQNKIIKVFTVVTVFFMPPTLISSIYGMNIELPFAAIGRWSFPITLGLMIASFLITWVYFKQRKIL
ncbi:MAG: magnesium and cobalt transport protein CorA [Prevotellaceae bacterium]|jgi:magnesium transporter|nr:magnesium and cobalt transport protein CorA [Prevotellaceae bacterium]